MGIARKSFPPSPFWEYPINGFINLVITIAIPKFKFNNFRFLPKIQPTKCVICSFKPDSPSDIAIKESHG